MSTDNVSFLECCWLERPLFGPKVRRNLMELDEIHKHIWRGKRAETEIEDGSWLPVLDGCFLSTIQLVLCTQGGRSPGQDSR